MRENKTCPNQGWQQMPTEELDRILQAELAKEHPSEEVVLPILHELEEREKDQPVEMTPEVLEIIEKLRTYETSSNQSKHRRKWLAGIAAVAAAACIVIMALPRTVGAESLFQVLFRWTNSVFEFFTPDQDASNPPVDVVFETDHSGLQQLYDKVTELGVTEPIVPMWLPEGVVLSELKEMTIAGGTRITCRCENGNKCIIIAYRISTDITAKFEKEDTSVEVFDYANVSHFILQNDEYTSVTWTVDGVECSLTTDIDEKDVYDIIRSIYGRTLREKNHTVYLFSYCT